MSKKVYLFFLFIFCMISSGCGVQNEDSMDYKKGEQNGFLFGS